MDIEKSIIVHNEYLDRMVAKKPFLKERLINRLENKNIKTNSTILVSLRKSILTFGILIVFLLILNFTFINELKKTKKKSQEVIKLDIDSFRLDFSSSINPAYEEVIK